MSRGNTHYKIDFNAVSKSRKKGKDGFTEGQSRFAYYYYHGDEDTIGNAKASYLAAYPDATESTASAASERLRSSGVIAARKFWDNVAREALELQTKNNKGIAASTELMEYWTTVMRGSLSVTESGRREFSISAGLKAAHELANVLGLYNTKMTDEDRIVGVSININEEQGNDTVEDKEVIEATFNEDNVLELPSGEEVE